MKYAIFFLFFVSGIYCQAQKKTAADPFAGIDIELQKVLNDRKAAGFAVAVVNKDKIIYAKGFGYRDMEKKLPVTAHTLFAIGSCSKAFTSSLMGLLNKEGKLEYDNPARNYLPELEFFNNELNNGVTVRDMMCHRTGLPRHDYSWYLFSTLSRDSLLQRLKYQEPTEPLRQKWQYNNFMFLTQGMIAEKLWGKSWEECIKEKIFTPLGMTNSNTAIEDLKKGNDAAIGYTLYKDSIIKKIDYYNINGMGPAGSINSNVNEMANWVITWINGGSFKGKEILPASYITEATSSQMVIAGGLPDKEIPDAHLSNYGFGWMLSSYRGHYRVEHGGNIDGFSASASFFPSDSIGIIVLTNQNRSALTGVVRNIIADRILGLKKIDWNERRNKADKEAKEAQKESKKSFVSNKKEGTKPSHDLAEYEGLYNHPGYGTMDIAYRNDSLVLITQNGEAWFRHYHYDIFELLNIDKEEGIDTTQQETFKLQFGMSPAGDISTVSGAFQPGLDDLLFNRKDRPKAIDQSELEKYAGTFEFAPGQNAKFYIKDEKTLYAFIEGQPEYELVPIGKDKFALKILSGYTVQFEVNEDGKVTAVSFIQPNGTFKAKKIL